MKMKNRETNSLSQRMLSSENLGSKLVEIMLAHRRDFKLKNKSFIKNLKGKKMKSKKQFFTRLLESTKESVTKFDINDRVKSLDRNSIVGSTEEVSFEETVNKFSGEGKIFLTSLNK